MRSLPAMKRNILGDDHIRGAAKKSLKLFVDGTTCVTKHNMGQHIDGQVSYIVLL